ncbi:uncharacterized protein LTR77_000438 [Saxophila tyrrhenica]|uniref:Uncharacterized protein n=1 Tax=Saxophila tyrrhenica TaxID=1690608 RepID=A0AAV9PRA8_9PEZI|nr:hypothetical protein LTR77_000438 [Saxophila tyrrhenica]
MSTTSIARTVYSTFTQTKVITSVIATSSTAPATFNIYYVDSTDNSSAPHNNFFQTVRAPGHGIVLANDANADSFGVDSLGRLVDLTLGLFISRNTDNVYPWEFLVARAESANTPICSLCNGILSCDYPGTVGNTFAICEGALALGMPDVFHHDLGGDGDGDIDCRAIALQFK